MKQDIEYGEAECRVHGVHESRIQVVNREVGMQKDNPFRQFRFPIDEQSTDDARGKVGEHSKTDDDTDRFEYDREHERQEDDKDWSADAE